MNMNVTEAEFNAVSNQLYLTYRNLSTPQLWRRLRAACDDANSAACVVTNGKINFKEAVIRKMVFEKLYHERKDKEIGKKCGKLQIAEIKDRERKSLHEIRQQIKAIKEGRSFTPTSPYLYSNITTPGVSPAFSYQVPFCPVSSYGGITHPHIGPLSPLSNISYVKDPYTGCRESWFKDPSACLRDPYSQIHTSPYGINTPLWIQQQQQQQALASCGVSPYGFGGFGVSGYGGYGTHGAYGTIPHQPFGSFGLWGQSGYPNIQSGVTATRPILPSTLGYRQSDLHDYYSEDLEDNEWEDNDDLLQHQGEDYENDGFMVPDITRILASSVGKQELRQQQEFKMGQKKVTKKEVPK